MGKKKKKTGKSSRAERHPVLLYARIGTVSRAEALSAAKKRRGKKPERRKVVQAKPETKEPGRATTGAACYSVEDYMCKVCYGKGWSMDKSSFFSALPSLRSLSSFPSHILLLSLSLHFLSLPFHLPLPPPLTLFLILFF